VGWLGLLLLVALAVTALGAPWLAPYDPRLTTGRPFDAPSGAHLLGTNDIGQDLLSELIWGGRASLTVGATAAIAAAVLGTCIGLLGGYFRGGVDTVLMRLTDLILVIPFLPLMILLAAYAGPSAASLALVIGLLLWGRPARVIRAAALGQSTRDHVTAARAIGAGDPRILRHHVLPGVYAIVIAEGVYLASRAILLEATLAFLGLGDPVQKSWGSMLFYAQARGAFLTGAWLWWVLPAGLLITCAVLGCALLGFAFERVANPRLRTR
jgi:ABC-type dipeptide/oligopeptide/nickel transport system permease subunit